MRSEQMFPRNEPVGVPEWSHITVSSMDSVMWRAILVD